MPNSKYATSDHESPKAKAMFAALSSPEMDECAMRAWEKEEAKLDHEAEVVRLMQEDWARRASKEEQTEEEPE